MTGVNYITVPGRPDPYEYRYTDACYIEDETRTIDGCIDGRIPEPDDGCAVGTMVPPRWARLRDVNGTPGPWILQVRHTCPGDHDFPISYDDFAILPIDPSPLELQPNAGWVYAGLDTVGLTSDAPQGFQVTLRGETFLVGAIPTEYSWDFGDGSAPLVTTDPGKPWPDHTVSHRYLSNGVVTPTLTTRWTGYFQILDTELWHEIEGTAETVTTGSEITVHTARTRLVEDPLA